MLTWMLLIFLKRNFQDYASIQTNKEKIFFWSGQ